MISTAMQIKRLTAVAVVAIGLAISFLASPSAHSQTLSLEQAQDNWGPLLGGMAATIIGHELGHFAAAEAEGVDAFFEDFTVKYEDQDGTPRQALRLSSAGFQAQWLISEAAFLKLKSPELSASKHAFYSGLVLGHIAISAAYALGLKDHEDGDATGIAAATSYSSDEIALYVALPAAIDAWRLLAGDPPRWLPWASMGSKAIGIAAVWRF